MTKLVLPPKYYLSHFFEFLDFVEEHYGAILDAEHLFFITEFRRLSEDAQCTYIRMVNRKGSIFEKKGFSKYDEIQNIDQAFAELEQKNFKMLLSENHNIPLLYFLTKAKLFKWLLACGIPTTSTMSRDQMISTAYNHIQLLNFDKLDERSQIFAQGQTQTIEYLMFLYFGRIQKSLTLYTLRDLGIRQSNTLKQQFKPRYLTSEHAQADYFFAKNLDVTFEYQTLPQLTELLTKAQSFQNLSSSTQHLKDELLFALGQYTLEKNQEITLGALSESRHPQAREKLVRYLYKLDRKSDCLGILEAMLTDPLSDQEILFAEDFLARKFNKKKIGSLTEVLQNSRQITLSDFYLKRPEIGVCELYKSLGYNAHFSENWLWLSLFGVLFWSELFESEEAAIHNQFQRTPSNLVGPEFYARNLESIETTLKSLKDTKSIAQKILQTVTKNYGRLNDLFQWNVSLAQQLIDFVHHAQKQDLALILRTMAQNFSSHCTGYPDLIIEKDGVVSFIEVKAEGDSLRASQLSRLRLIKDAGFAVEVLRVKWEADPNQIYVVVDVETTGGSAAFHRVTEIGAVKIQNGLIIDEFQTLINPGRSIPSFITGITGITNEMVAKAPAFSDIAESFFKFLDGAVFVAHNVNFDYGFIQREFTKSGIEFVRPHLCTCAGMRKTHPGLKSYGLKNLTQHFEITLDQHHRALSDARAAAQLLLLMNDKRSQSDIKFSETHSEIS